MLKILEAIALFILEHALNKPKSPHPGIGAEFLASKGRIMILSLVAGITLSILLAGGLLMAFVGSALWFSDDSMTASHWLVYHGLGLSVIAGLVTAFAFSKKRFNLDTDKEKEEKEKQLSTQPSPMQVVEEIALTVIKDLVKERKEKKEHPEHREHKVHKPTTTAAPHTPTSVHTA